MAQRHHEITSNQLSVTATADNVSRMSKHVKKQHRQQNSFRLEEEADISGLRNRERFIKEVDGQAKNAMTAISEDDETNATPARRQLTQKELHQTRQAILNSRKYDELLEDTDKIKDSFRARLRDIYSICHDFICLPVDRPARPRWVQIRRIDREVNAHVAKFAHDRQQVASDVAELKDFLRGQLFDQYCLMKETPMEKKNETWLRYGKSLLRGKEIGEQEKPLRQESAKNVDLGARELQDRLRDMIEESGLEPEWVMDSIEDYSIGNDHIGRWQRYAQERRWVRLAAKLTKDTQQLEKINGSSSESSDGRRCNITINIHNTKRQYFRRLDGAHDFDLGDSIEDASVSSSTMSLADGS